MCSNSTTKSKNMPSNHYKLLPMLIIIETEDSCKLKIIPQNRELERSYNVSIWKKQQNSMESDTKNQTLTASRIQPCLVHSSHCTTNSRKLKIYPTDSHNLYLGVLVQVLQSSTSIQNTWFPCYRRGKNIPNSISKYTEPLYLFHYHVFLSLK